MYDFYELRTFLIGARPQVPADVQRPIQRPHVLPADLSLDPLPVEDVEAAVTAVAHGLCELVPLVDDDLGVDESARRKSWPFPSTLEPILRTF